MNVLYILFFTKDFTFRIINKSYRIKNIKSYEDAIDPEVLVHGVSRMLYSQLQDNLKRKSIDITRMIEEKDFDQINARMELFHHFLDAASDITKQMNSPAYKARITKLKNKEEYGVM